MNDSAKDSKKHIKKDIAVILTVSFISAALYLTPEGTIMDYGRDVSQPLLLRFLPVLLIQFGMSCLGILIVLLKNQEKLSTYGLVWHHALQSIAGCLLVSVPTVVFLFAVNEIHGFLPFQGMFLTKEILGASLPFNVIGYLIILMYGSLVIREKTGNAWGNILIFFVIWNAL
ncbi:MAG: hypothetical protein OSJ72_13580 [Lachnospiraceae bacterium]|nr:hypothetical protein [Lachnospiraceae bacterium]